MTTEELMAAYKKAFKRPPPLRASEAFVLANVLYSQQAGFYGGLKSSTIRQLQTLADGTVNLREGTIIIRSWRGQTFEVTVTADGSFIFQNQSYRSLSAIAFAITGTKWNGRIFFGVKRVLHG